MTQNELMHYGVEGMKWGVRRYQNEDGSYKKSAEGRYDGKIIRTGKAVSIAKKSASEAASKAYKQSLNELKQHNKEVRNAKKSEEYLNNKYSKEQRDRYSTYSANQVAVADAVAAVFQTSTGLGLASIISDMGLNQTSKAGQAACAALLAGDLAYTAVVDAKLVKDAIDAKQYEKDSSN